MSVRDRAGQVWSVRAGQVMSGRNRTGHANTAQRTCHIWTGHRQVRTRQGWSGQVGIGPGRTGRTGQVWIRQGWSDQDRSRQDRSVQHSTGHKTGLVRS